MTTLAQLPGRLDAVASGQSGPADPNLRRGVDVGRGRRSLRRRLRAAQPGPEEGSQRLPVSGLDTPSGSIELAVPKLRQGSYFPDWLLERRRRAESALVNVVATSYLARRQHPQDREAGPNLGITRLSKSQVSEMAEDLDSQAEAFRARPLDAGQYTFVVADALVWKIPEQAAYSPCMPYSLPGVNADGYRDILGLHMTSAEDGAG